MIKFTNSGQFKKGHIPWSKGKKRGPHTEEWKKNMRIKILGLKRSEETKNKMRGINNYFYGKHHSKETIEKVIASNKRRVGIKSARWKGGVTPENVKIRHSIDNDLWRNSVFARDNYTCQKTGQIGGKLRVHHIKNFAQYPELRFAIDNGITLSDKAHIQFHKIYGTM